jgi:hypothetical protein
MKALICIPSPREIPEVKAVIDRLPDDKLWLKYYTPEILAYNIIYEQFMDSDYTHIVLIPDDLVVSLRDYEILKEDMAKYPENVVCGYCNVDTTTFKECANITFDRVRSLREGRSYNWVMLRDIEPRQDIVSVGFAGFPMFAIPKVVFNRGIKFRNDSFNGQDWSGCCVDVMFCADVKDKGIDILCDLRLHENHLKISDAAFTNFKAGIEQPYFYYEKLASQTQNI